MRDRVLTALWYAPLFLFTAYLGPPWFTGLLALTALLAGWEFYRLTKVPRHLAWVGIVFMAALVLGAHFLPQPPGLGGATALAVMGVLLGRSGWIVRGGRWVAWLAGVLYAGGMLTFWIYLRDLPGGREWAIYGLLVVFLFDTLAFFTGRRWGRHPLAPRISPGKTYEGAVGGAAAAVATAAILSPLLSLPLTALPLALALSLAAQVGDLTESSLKRSAGVKDSGSLLPGHGGVLDRIDSLLFAGPVLYYGVIWLG